MNFYHFIRRLNKFFYVRIIPLYRYFRFFKIVQVRCLCFENILNSYLDIFFLTHFLFQKDSEISKTIWHLLKMARMRKRIFIMFYLWYVYKDYFLTHNHYINKIIKHIKKTIRFLIRLT